MPSPKRIDDSSYRQKAPTVAVYTRARWSDEWTARENLVCESVEFCCSPTRSEAALRWTFGRGAQPGERTRQEVEPLSIVGPYVKITITLDDPFAQQIPAWYGRIQEDAEDRHACLRDAAGDRVRKGIARLIAWGLEAELDNCPITSSRIEHAAGEKTIRRAIGFNLGPGRPQDRSLAVNRSKEKGEKSYVFARSLNWTVYGQEAEFWTAEEIIEYLLAWHGPRDTDDAESIPWELDDDQVEHLALHKPPLAAEGLSVKKAIDALIDRRRAAGWYIEVDDEAQPEKVRVKSFRFNEEEIVIQEAAGEKVIPANPQQVELDFDRALDVRESQVRTSDAAYADQVIVRGSPIGAVFTISSGSGRIEGDWSVSDAASYNAGASGSAGYGALEKCDKERRNDNARMAEALQRVFAWFQLDDAWDGLGEDGVGGNTSPAILGQHETEADDVTIGDLDWTTAVDYWRPGLRFQKTLPLRENEDYTGSRIENGSIPASGEGEGMPPLVAIKLESDGSGTDRYQFVDRLAATSRNERVDEAGRTWSCAVRMRDDAAGFTLKVSGQAQQHKIASADFGPLPGVEEIPADLNWRNNLVATVYVLTDRHVEVRHPSDEDVKAVAEAAGTPIRRLWIDLPETHLDYVLPNTVVGIADGVLQRSTSGGLVRDDLDKMRLVARIAAQWYTTTRRAMTLSFRQIRRVVDLGDLITTIGDGATKTTINTCVTRIRYDLVAGVTTIQTQYAELDAKAL